MRRFGIIVVFGLLAEIFTGCGGGSSSTGTVTSVTISPAGLSLNSGQVVQLSATPNVSSGTAPTVTYATSNPSVASISPSGLVCAGVWESQFINCNGDDANGNPISGSATITASAGGVTSAPVPVTVHIAVTSVIVSPVSGCTSTTSTQQFNGAACSSVAQPPDTTGLCAPSAKNITTEVGGLTWGTIDSSVATVNSTGLVTAVAPGLTGVFASTSASTVTSAPVPFTTCMPIEIRLHQQGSPTESATFTTATSITIEADMVDSNGFTQNSIATIIGSNYPTVASISGLTLTGNVAGGAGVTAACAPPTCGNGFNTPVYSNLFPVTFSGTSTAPTVYVTSSFTPPSGTSPTLVPINFNQTTPALGTAIALPGVANSMVFSADGTVAYLGTNAGLVSFTPATSTVSIVDATIFGKVLSVSANGTIVLVSNAAADPEGNVIEPIGPSQRLWAFQEPTSGGAGTTQTFVQPGAIAATTNSDDFRSYVATNDGTGHVYVFSPRLSLQTITLPRKTLLGTPPPPANVATGVAILPQGSFAYVADENGLETLATCNNVTQALTPTTNSTTNLQMVSQVPNANMIVAVDSPGIDVVTANVSSIFSANPPIPFNFTASNCQPNVNYSNQFINFGAGAFTASELFVATNGTRVAVVPAGSANILTAVPGSSPSVATIPLAAGATQAFGGGMTPDGNTLFVGVAGPTPGIHEINLSTGSDTLQISTSFLQSNNNPATPDVVAVQPQ